MGTSFDRSLAFTALLDVSPDVFGQMTTEEGGRVITRFLADWGQSPYRNMHAFAEDWTGTGALNRELNVYRIRRWNAAPPAQRGEARSMLIAAHSAFEARRLAIAHRAGCPDEHIWTSEALSIIDPLSHEGTPKVLSVTAEGDV